MRYNIAHRIKSQGEQAENCMRNLRRFQVSI